MKRTSVILGAMMLFFGPTSAQTFAVIGDFGLNSAGQNKVATLVKSWNPEFIITVGDNNYPDGEWETIDINIGKNYSEFIYPYVGEYGPGDTVNRFWPSLGNHDIVEKNGQAHFDYFELPNNERYYDFVEGDIHFFALNSNREEVDGFDYQSIQGNWLKERLTASESKWKVIYFHHPPYTSGPHGDSKWMQWPFEEWGASIVLSGHDHLYERLEVEGFPYLINGAGGASIYPFYEVSRYSKLQYDERYGALKVTVTEKGLVFEFINVGGEVIDMLVIPDPTSQKR